MDKWETLYEVLEAIEGWGLRRAVLGPPEAEEAQRALAMVRETRARSELEYGHESDDAAKMRAIEAALAH